MARPLRIAYPGACYHVTSRGNEKQAVFKDDTDRETFLRLLAHVTTRYHWLCHAYCLMDNHYHLLIETPDANLSLGMRQLNGVYTQAFNRRHARTGHLFQGRFQGILIQKEPHLLEVCRYVVLNPVRACRVERPGDWRWSSYRATAGKAKPPACLTTDGILGPFSRTRARAEKAYRQFVQGGMGKETLWAEVKGQVLLGDDAFVATLAAYLKRHQDVPEIPKSQRYAHRPALEKIFTESVLCDRKKRDRKMAEAVEHYGYTQRAIADHLDLHFSYVSRILCGRARR